MMVPLIEVKVDEVEARKMILLRIAELVREVDAEYVFWDAAELKKRTCMSWNTIQTYFFFDTRFIKRKIGGKWYFPAKDTREFLRIWLLEQPKS